MSFVSQTVAGILRGSIGSSSNKEKCDYCENYTCQKHHSTYPKPSEEYKNYITLLQQCSSETTNSEETTSESESIVPNNPHSTENTDKSYNKNFFVSQEKEKKVDFSD